MFLLQPLPDILYKYLLFLTVQVHLVTSYHYWNVLVGKGRLFTPRKQTHFEVFSLLLDLVQPSLDKQ